MNHIVMVNNLYTVVSVIMPAFNSERTIADSIKCVLNQTYKNWELIIINDCSTDDTVNIVNQFTIDERIKLYNCTKNSGMSFARNLGVSYAIGEFVSFLDSDDIWFPDKLTKQLKFHHTHKEYLISHSGFVEFDSKKKERKMWRQRMVPYFRKAGNLLPLLYYNNIVATLTVMMKRELFLIMNGFNENIYSIEDYDLWFRISKAGYKFGYIDEVLCKYRLNEEGVSKNIAKYKSATKKFLNQTIYNDTKILPKYQRRIRSNYFLMFGRLYAKNKDYFLADKYYCTALSKININVYYLIPSIIFLLINKIQKCRYGA